MQVYRKDFTVFNISFSEILLVLLVAILAFKPSELIDLAKTISGLATSFKKTYHEFIEYLRRELGEEDVVKVIFDEDGVPHKAYDLSKLEPFLHGNSKPQEKEPVKNEQ